MLQFLHEDALFAICLCLFNQLHLRDMNDFRSWRYMENRSGGRFSPCRTPMVQVKKSDFASVVNATLNTGPTFVSRIHIAICLWTTSVYSNLSTLG